VTSLAAIWFGSFMAEDWHYPPGASAGRRLKGP
jgi:hypothetical protein